MSSTPTHGSDVQVTPDWWKASDGRFYPPELHPDYKAPVASTLVGGLLPSQQGLSLADRLREATARVADDATSEASAGADGVRATLDSRHSTMDDAMSKPERPDTNPEAPDAMAKPEVPDAAPLVAEPRATVALAPPAGPPIIPSEHTVIQASADLRQVGSATVAPGARPPAPSAPTSVPQVPGPPQYSAPSAPTYSAPSAPTYSAPSAPTYSAPSAPTYGAPSAPTSPPGAPSYGVPAPAAYPYQPPAGAAPAAATKVSSGTAGLMAFVAGAASIAGSLLQWGKGAVTGADGVEKATIAVAGFDSNGLITAICGGVLILCGILFFVGVPKQLYWAIAAFIAGGVIVGAVVFSLIDIGDLSSRYAAEWQANGFAALGDVISTKADIGLWITGAGGVIGVLAAPFVNRS